MYTKFYGFNEKPFNLVPNPAYLFFSNQHEHALTFLEYGIAEKIGFVMLTGEIGIGKTTLLRYILNRIESEMDVALVFNTNVGPDDFMHLVLNELNIEFDDTVSKAKALDLLYAYLIEKYAQKRKVLLVIDEAQNLSDEVIEEIRMLSNLQTDEESLLQILMVGQPELREKIQAPRHEQFAQRIAVSYHLCALNLNESKSYIAHRIEKAGGPSGLFTDESIEKVFAASNGIPRTINLICDAALVYGFADEKKVIDPEIIDQVVEKNGGMGIFIRPDINKRRMGRLTPDLNDTDTCKDVILNLKTTLALERKKYSKLALRYNKLRERYQLERLSQFGPAREAVESLLPGQVE